MYNYLLTINMKPIICRTAIEYMYNYKISGILNISYGTGKHKQPLK